MKFFIFLILTLLFSTLYACALPLFVDRLLLETGKAHSCYFAIEEVFGDSILLKPVDAATIPQSLDDDLNLLKKTCPNISIRQDILNSRIYYISDSKISVGSTALDRRVPDFSYNGLLINLFSVLEKAGIAVKSKGLTQPLISNVRMDLSTKVDIIANDKTLREILTDYLPLSNYGPLLWSASINLASPDKPIYIEYFGPKDVQAKLLSGKAGKQ